MQIHETGIPGCYEIKPDMFKDERGFLVKTFHDDFFLKHQLKTRYAEHYHSFSYQNVLRGLHFQIPPKSHDKLVYCMSGRAADAVVDLRAGSPAYGRFAMVELSGEAGNMIYIPAGLAHGFCVLSSSAILVYHVTTVHSPEHDKGIRWDSAGIPWPVRYPVLSDRDRSFPQLDHFNSPFAFRNAAEAEGGKPDDE